ncbi:hypothetical protein CK203_116497 [Vitis vinifera]|uniref:Uncharacterized protein n=1 Tax=Vitis vinifera TaxID=29760 RepID=A0A438C9Z8_VITVI|nr:hypothetical protein CK203_116497 [Vitis vinifera]
MASASNGFEAKLRDVENKLLHPPSSADELLPLLEVEQQPCMSTKIALSPLMESLVADQILKHGKGGVEVSAVACISEITRITAPDAPYDDNQMTAVSILKSVATYRWCLVAKQFSEDAACPREVGASGDESLKSMICNDASQTKNGTFIDGNPSNRLDQHSTKKLLVETTDKPVNIPQKRSWKPYFLANPAEGYDYLLDWEEEKG